jgi:serine/threonine-protein kinase
MLAAGSLLAGRYRVVRRLGAGGAGAVLLAHDEVLERDVAVKVLHPSADSSTGRRIQREARLGAGLQHPNLVTVFDVVVEGDVLMLVMEHVPGETLAAVLERGPLAPGRAVAILRPLADALDFVHARGVVHRDVKPPNVLLRDDDRVKLADLGIAAAEDLSRITQAGGVLGTLAYMAPEQLEPQDDGRITPAVDVFALAAVAFEALAGRRARRGTTTVELVAAATNAPPPDLRQDRPDLPPAAADVLRRGMARAPEARPASAGALVAELEAALRPAPAAAAPATRTVPVPVAPAPVPAPAPARPAAAEPSEPLPTPRRRRRALLAPLALLAAVAAAALAVALARDDPADRAATPPASTATTATTTADPPRTAPPARAGASPDGAVRALYTRAANDDFDGAWALAGAGLRTQLGGRASFEATFATLEAITFDRLKVESATDTAATVELRTEARHTTYTQRCEGTAQAARAAGAGWRVEAVAIACEERT